MMVSSMVTLLIKDSEVCYQFDNAENVKIIHNALPPVHKLLSQELTDMTSCGGTHTHLLHILELSNFNVLYSYAHSRTLMFWLQKCKVLFILEGLSQLRICLSWDG